MKMQSFTSIIIMLFITLISSPSASQSVEIQGEAKVTQMTNDDKIDEIVVRKPDGTLATRSAQSLPSSFIDTTRNLNTDFELAKHICACGTNLPPYLIESLLDAGYSTQDLIKAGVPFTSLSEIVTTVYDIDGNEYDIVIIGTQQWLKQNLRVTQYNDGTPIDLQLSDSDWAQAIDAKLPAYSYPDGNINNVEQYGLIYSSFTGIPGYNANKNMCPIGWSVPLNSDFNVLREYLEPGASSYDNTAGIFVKKTGTDQWLAPNLGANNLTGFDGVPAGGRWSTGNYVFFESKHIMNTVDLTGSTNILQNHTAYDDLSLRHGATTLALGGAAIRCIKD